MDDDAPKGKHEGRKGEWEKGLKAAYIQALTARTCWTSRGKRKGGFCFDGVGVDAHLLLVPHCYICSFLHSRFLFHKERSNGDLESSRSIALCYGIKRKVFKGGGRKREKKTNYTPRAHATQDAELRPPTHSPAISFPPSRTPPPNHSTAAPLSHDTLFS